MYLLQDSKEAVMVDENGNIKLVESGVGAAKVNGFSGTDNIAYVSSQEMNFVAASQTRNPTTKDSLSDTKISARKSLPVSNSHQAGDVVVAKTTTNYDDDNSSDDGTSL